MGYVRLLLHVASAFAADKSSAVADRHGGGNGAFTLRDKQRTACRFTYQGFLIYTYQR